MQESEPKLIFMAMSFMYELIIIYLIYSFLSLIANFLYELSKIKAFKLMFIICNFLVTTSNMSDFFASIFILD